MNYLRERMGKILAITIGGALVVFIIGEVARSGGSIMKDDADELGSVDGQKISYTEFKNKVDQNTENMRQQYGQVSPQITNYVQESTWGQMVNQVIVNKEIENTGLSVGQNELQAMISGPEPSQQIVQAFTNPQTGQFDRGQLNTFLSYLQTAKDNDPKKQQWLEFVSQIKQATLGEKYLALVTNGLYVNSLDAKNDYESKNKLVNFKYATVSYASVPDSKVSVTDADYQEYYDAHKFMFKNPQELRNFQYVSFNGAASKDDSAAAKAQLEKLIPDFKTTKDDSAFVAMNAETKAPLTYQKKGHLDPKVDSLMFNAANGFVYGPYESNGSYKIAKLVDTRVGPDSVKARHILLDPNAAGSIDKAKAKADSIEAQIKAGKSFADMASMYSIDKGSAAKGGELGTFSRGQMVPVFEDAVFNGKKGDMKIVVSQFGVHLIEIEDQKGSAKVAKVAVIDKPITASKTTQDAAYNKARSFLSTLNKDNFAQQAKAAGVPIKSANDITAVANGAPGLDNARDLIRWVYKAKPGDFSDQVYAEGNQYIIAYLTTIKPKGVLPLDVIKNDITPQVRNHVKAKMLIEKMQSASTIDQAAQKADTKVVPTQNIVFANPILPGVGAEYKVIGTVFGSQPNKLSKPIEGETGVFVFTVDNFVNPAPLANAVREKQQIGQMMLQRAQGQLFEALKDKANVKDNRAKFL